VEQSGRVAVLVDDMFFASKINGAAQAAGREVARVRSREQLESEIASSPPSLVIIDLNSDRVDPLEAISLIKTRPEMDNSPIVAFVSHVQTDLIRRAQEAGCDYVLPRSAFTQMLNQIVAGDLSSFAKARQ